MQIGIVLADGSWPEITDAVRLADRAGLDAVGFWDHYHSANPNFAPHNGWAVYGFLAAATSQIKLCPLVLDGPNYSIGRLAKESTMLSILSDGRFELGIGIGDIPEEETAWGQPPYASATARIAWLQEVIAALRLAWTGKPVDYAGDHIQLAGATCAPPPPVPPRVVVGAGTSPRLIRSAVTYADEINVYGDTKAIQHSWEAIRTSGRTIRLSTCVDEFEHFGSHVPGTLTEQLATWRDRGVDRLFITLYAPFALLPRLCEAIA